MKRYAFLLKSVVVMTLLGFATMSQALVQRDTQKLSSKAPPQTAQFGQLVGQWKIADFYLDKKGQWQPSNGADWHFYWILGGSAIQDDWVSPSMDKPEPKAGRQFGTNIRIFNPKLDRWEMAWAANNGAKVDTFVATAQEGALVMTGVFNGSDSRITFYDITNKQFFWRLEQKNKKTNEWKETYRIEGTRIH
jgi:hypothetical protein